MSGVTRNNDVQELKNMIEEHVDATGSEARQRNSRTILKNYLPNIQKDYTYSIIRKMLECLSTKYNRKGSQLRSRQRLEAFYEHYVKEDGNNGKDQQDSWSIERKIKPG